MHLKDCRHWNTERYKFQQCSFLFEVSIPPDDIYHLFERLAITLKNPWDNGICLVRPEQNGCFAGNIFKSILLNENCRILFKISLNAQLTYTHHSFR